MMQLINDLVYDTETSTKIESVDNQHSEHSAFYKCTTLYKGENGNYFLYHITGTKQFVVEPVLEEEVIDFLCGNGFLETAVSLYPDKFKRA